MSARTRQKVLQHIVQDIPLAVSQVRRGRHHHSLHRLSGSSDVAIAHLMASQVLQNAGQQPVGPVDAPSLQRQLRQTKVEAFRQLSDGQPATSVQMFQQGSLYLLLHRLRPFG